MLTRHNAIDLVVSSEREAEIKYIMHPFYHYIDLLKSVLDGRSGMIVTNRYRGQPRIRSFHAEVNASVPSANVLVCFSNPVGIFWPSAGWQGASSKVKYRNRSCLACFPMLGIAQLV